jgi:type I restriction enzyme S subunit
VAHLGEVLKKSESWVTLAPDVEYQEVTVRLWGRGVTQRRQVTGAEIGSARRLQVRPRQFILSRIDARNGAFGLIPQELDGAVVSNDFPVFDVNENRMLPEYLGWMSRTVTFVEACKTASEGTTNRVRLKEETFLRMPLPLPPLAEQRRIVAMIDHLTAKVQEARNIRRRADKEVEMLLDGALCQQFVLEASQWTSMAMEEAIEIKDKQVNPSLPLYSQLPHISGENIESKTCRLLPWRTAEADGAHSQI